MTVRRFTGDLAHQRRLRVIAALNRRRLKCAAAIGNHDERAAHLAPHTALTDGDAGLICVAANLKHSTAGLDTHAAARERRAQRPLQGAILDDITEGRHSGLRGGQLDATEAPALRDVNFQDRCCRWREWPDAQTFEQKTAAVRECQCAGIIFTTAGGTRLQQSDRAAAPLKTKCECRADRTAAYNKNVAALIHTSTLQSRQPI